jgi:indole-3-glycerol phosphate synthase
MAASTEDLPNGYVSRTATEPQQGISWTAPGGVLGRLIGLAQARAAELRPLRGELERRAADAPPRSSFAAALRGADVAVIAEIKRASPSQGDIRSGLDAAAQAVAYVEGGAAAISVLTEPSHFGGSLGDLERTSAAVAIPLLRKDFIVSEEQILEAVAAGASAVLLIARALRPQRLGELAAFAVSLRADALVEVRDAAELTRALGTPVRTVGVNARDLETLEIDHAPILPLLAAVPDDRIAIAESGIQDAADVMRVGGAGADAVLVGSAVSAAKDPAAAVRSLTGIPRKARAPGS